MALERFDPEVTHMIVFDVLSSKSPIGDKGERMRLFLTEAGYKKVLENQDRSFIQILNHILLWVFRACSRSAKIIYEAHPFLEYRIFELVQTNEFLNHQIAHNSVFVYVEADLGDFVFETLKEKFPGKILLNPSVEEYHLYWQRFVKIVKNSS